ncbi:MAG: hypothetical protein IT323_17010, partial [Anaerolineae bacterium]|nr:hypothetical protein [Anaerolineae bacterium]
MTAAGQNVKESEPFAAEGGPSARSALQIGDIVAFFASLLILIGYVALPLATNFAPGATGAAFSDQRTTFLVLTFVVGIVGLLSVAIHALTLRERSIRWWYVGLGFLALLLFVDNTLLAGRFLDARAARSAGIWKVLLDTGGLLMLMGSLLLVAQAALPR